MAEHRDDRSRPTPGAASRTPRTPGRIRLALAAAVVAVLAAACASTVAGVAADGPTAASTSSDSAPTTEDTSTTDGTTTSSETSTTDDTPTSDDTSTTTPTESTTESSTDTSTTDGSSTTPSTSDSSSSGGSDDARLYPTKPIPYNATPNTEGIASLLEGRRLAGYVLDPAQIDPRLTDFVAIPTFPLRDAETLGVIFPNESTQQIAKRQGMYSGYSAARRDPAGKASMVLAVFVFPSAAAAQKAATGMATSSKGAGDTVVKYPDLPGAIGNQGAAGTTEFTGQAFVASGQVVVYVYVSGGVSQKATVAPRMKVALTKQVAAIKKYTPVAKAALMSQKFDPTGLYARTLPPEENYTVYGMYSQQGALHTQSEPLKSAQVFAAAGVDLVSIARSVLYRAKDATGAAAVRDAFYAQEIGANTRYRDFDPGTTAGAPRCLEDSVQSQYVCYATVDRVTIEYSSQSENDLKRSLEAQVALLQQ